MSIMYEALHKTQPENDALTLEASQDNMTLDDWIDVAIALIIAVLLAAIMVAHYPRFNNVKMVFSKTNDAVVLEIPDEAIAPHVPKVPATPSQPVIKPAEKNTPPVALPFEDAEYKSKHTLNGVFVSDEEKVAMINNRFFNIGDMVDGMKIITIEPDKIKLQNERGILELKIIV